MLHKYDTTITGTLNFGLVALSIVIAVIASAVALNLANRIRNAEASQRPRWLTAGAVAMGVGIWAMHFTGMLAYDLNMPVRYDIPTVLISLVAAIGAAAVALNVIYRGNTTWPRLVLGGTLMGAGIGAMHYIGMYAMRMEARTIYNPGYFLLSVVVAVVIAVVALWFTTQTLSDGKTAGGDLIAGAILMGMGVASMHYTAMVAASFEPHQGVVGGTAFAADLSSVWLGAIVLLTLLVLGVTFRVGQSPAKAVTMPVAESGD